VLLAKAAVMPERLVEVEEVIAVFAQRRRLVVGDPRIGEQAELIGRKAMSCRALACAK